jgi:CRP/FNR family transcriptional regulator, cyclic AMP receptor protein
MVPDYVGYLASALVLCTFCARTMIPLRAIALGSNIAFIIYGGFLHLYPVLFLHVILLPLNAWRLAEILLLSRRVRAKMNTDAVFEALLPFATRIAVHRGQTVIRKGDPADCLYLLFEGVLRVADAEVELGPGSVFGEMGVLSHTRLRTATVTANTDCVLGRISAQDFDRVYFTNPSLGLSLIRLIIERLTDEVEARRLETVRIPIAAA